MINDKKKKQVDADKAAQAIDQAFEMGFQQGYSDAKKDAMIENAMQQQEMMGGAASLNPGAMERPQVAPGQMGMSENSVPSDMQMPEAGQLTEATDSLINALHGASGDMPEEVKKAAQELSSLTKAVKENIEIRKIQAGTESLKKSMASLGTAKKMVVAQQDETVTSLLKKWEDESKKAVKKMVEIANQHKTLEE